MHGDTEAGRQGFAQEPHQIAGMHKSDGGDNDATGQHDRPPSAQHSGDDGDHTGIENQQPDHLPRVGRIRAAPQQRIGEVPAPDQDGVAGSTQAEQVDQ